MENLLYDLNDQLSCAKDKDALVFIIKNYAFQLFIPQILSSLSCAKHSNIGGRYLS